MKKFISTVLALGMAASLAACGGTCKDTGNPGERTNDRG